MQMVLVLLAALFSPLLALALLLWLSWLEDGLPRAVDAAQRQPVPEPILAVPVHDLDPVGPVVAVAAPPAAHEAAPLPEQRTAPVPDLAAPQPAVGG